ncbi:uncharacterized protein K460DRAFT_405843 [Cucurbitaria berberidis CBS 394.84]|uniref:Integral membrane protein n=1 Tax=Cucurbitaria berberidis CBS 394.84 TaxID=1168544 RepID=A0A9P4GGD8_9PLEO|nr:uncharacterized protein K460DRAFT_405843 [Cucurbitaria berberidis CBS 394.84]KAF1845593.1 hypothetical protein K460DRAFT_405843 [Cucurbitaria berberidis CBS 394.84]
MKIGLFLLCIAQIATVLALDFPSVFDYSQLPSCARNCKILETSELNCVPPTAPSSSQATYVDCLCQSEYLRSLHANGEICHDVCDEKDDLAIYHSYNSICNTPNRAPTTSTTPTVTPSSSPVAGTSDTATSTPTKDGQDKLNHQGTWFRRNWKYILLASFLTLSIFSILLSLAYCYRRKQRKSNLENSRKRNGLIPLQLVPSQSIQPLRSDDRSDWPLRSPSSAGPRTYDLGGPSISSPHAPPTSSYSLRNSPSRKQESLIGQKERIIRRSSRTVAGAQLRSLEDTERLIQERMRNTGGPGIPLPPRSKIQH